jgi:hypothetical protein
MASLEIREFNNQDGYVCLTDMALNILGVTKALPGVSKSIME